MRIRLLKRSEIDVVSKLFVESYKKDEKHRRWTEEYAKKYILMLYRLSKELCFVAVENERIIGVSLSLILPDFNKEVLESKVLLVHPEYRRKKVASKLLRKTCLKAQNKFGIEEIETGIYTLTNFPITWYERIGFRTVKHYEITRASIEKILMVV